MLSTHTGTNSSDSVEDTLPINKAKSLMSLEVKMRKVPMFRLMPEATVLTKDGELSILIRKIRK